MIFPKWQRSLAITKRCSKNAAARIRSHDQQQQESRMKMKSKTEAAGSRTCDPVCTTKRSDQRRQSSHHVIFQLLKILTSTLQLQFQKLNFKRSNFVNRRQQAATSEGNREQQLISSFFFPFFLRMNPSFISFNCSGVIFNFLNQVVITTFSFLFVFYVFSPSQFINPNFLILIPLDSGLN